MTDSTGPLIGTLYLAGVITADEADVLQRRLPGMGIPMKWQDFVKQIEEIIQREL